MFNIFFNSFSYSFLNEILSEFLFSISIFISSYKLSLFFSLFSSSSLLDILSSLFCSIFSLSISLLLDKFCSTFSSNSFLPKSSLISLEFIISEVSIFICSGTFGLIFSFSIFSSVANFSALLLLILDIIFILSSILLFKFSFIFS